MRFIYIDTSGNIEKIDGEKIELDIISNKSVLSKTKLLDILRKRKKIKYIYSDSLLFHVDLYANQMQYSDYSSFLNKITIFDDIIFNPSIFVFHSLSTIYVFYKKKYNSILNKTRKNITPEIR
jgi:hypothetical protein